MLLIIILPVIIIFIIMIILIILLSKGEKNKKNDDFYSKSRETKTNLGQKLRKLFSGRKIDEKALEELEEILLKADVGPKIAYELIEILRNKMPKDTEDAISLLKNAIDNMLIEKNLKIKKGELNILLVLGVNGVGKTTTIAKLANLYLKKGYKVLLAAGDTFRAAAIEQLTKWANRLDIPVIKQKENSDPSSVVFDAIDSAKAKQVDLLIIDTAGRLHNKANLMEELKKIERIINKKGDYHKQNILVIDATTGQNAFHQASSFNEAIGINGIIMAKYDSQSKGGIVINIQKNLNIPFYFIGTGEKLDNIEEFNKDEFIKNIFA